jgi:ATP-dependent DNA helicase DinG
VVMARLPFAVVNDPVLEARCEQIAAEGRSPFRELSLPQAVIRFRQGFGRLIRTRSDKGVVIVADSRIVTKNYGATFKRSLPCPVCEADDMDSLLRHIERLFPVPS